MTYSQKIENPKTKLSGKSAINDEDLLSTVLSTEKNLAHTYEMAIHNASHEALHSLLFDMLKVTSNQHRKLLDLQFQHGWCSLTPANPSEIKALEQEYSEYRQQLK